MIVSSLVLGLSLGILAPVGASKPSLSNPTRRFDQWFHRYQDQKIIFPRTKEEIPAKKKRGLRIESLGPKSKLGKILEGLVEEGNIKCGERLLQLATFRFDADPHLERQNFGLQQPWAVRFMAREALGRIRQDQTLEWLAGEVLLGKEKRSLEERMAALHALGLSGHHPALLGVLSALTDDSWKIRAAAAEAAGKIGGVRAARAIALNLADKDPSVRTRCIDALTHSFEPAHPQVDQKIRRGILNSLSRSLSDPDWRVRIAAGDFFLNHPVNAAIPLLIDALDKEGRALANQEGRKRVYHHLLQLLQRVTGADIRTGEVEDWKQWWEENKTRDFSTPQASTALKAEGIPYYFGIPVQTDNMIFILDVSGSMKEFCDPMLVSGVSFPVAATRKKQTKLDWAKAGLRETLKKLKPTDRFNIILFETWVMPLFDTTVPATPRNVALALEKIDNISTGGGGTNIFGALELALKIKDLGSVDPFQTDADTIFLLSDGNPSTGLIVDPDTILKTVSSANRGSRIALHTVCFGGDEGPGSLQFMKDAALQNYGEFRYAVRR